ncbi:MAG: hypothetical protein COA65_08750 [Rhodospirillaceae bacterium]|nr:MAG: hypothetical protein COA65_08750 [Rhodospirillaceae bacterium]
MKKKTLKPLDKGVVILAMGNAYWGRWAYNLAMSLKYSSPEVKISLLYSGDGLNHIVDKSLFDKLIPVPPEHYTTDGRVQYLKAKTAIYKLSPYKETISLDADMVWLPKKSINDLFHELKDVEFTMANRSWMALESDLLTDAFGVWASPKHIKEVFNFKKGRFYNLSSEMIYFKKSKQISKLFSDASKLFDNESFNYTYFNNGMPDELPFTISMIKNEIYPHKDNYKPFYWESAEHLRLQGADLNNGFYAYSMGGHISHPMMKRTYDNYVRFYCNQFNQRFPFFWKDKRGWMPGRQNL